jgi:hypothetical protein
MDVNFPGMNIEGPAKNIGAQGKKEVGQGMHA